MIYNEHEYLLLSGIQHFLFCSRQWALIHIENIWAENTLTTQGKLMHGRAHDPYFSEKRKDLLITRDMPIVSHKLGVTGKCDVVEFRKDDETGVSLFGRKGKWLPCPVEYKRGRPKSTDIDRVQLCAQAICLEEMLLCPRIEEAHIFYGETKRREKVALTKELRLQVESTFFEMHGLYKQGITPRVKASKSCNACSLKNECLPKLPAVTSVRGYIDVQLTENPI